MRVAVITVSDRAARGEYTDRSGPAVEQALREQASDVQIEREVVADEREAIRAALLRHKDADWIITTGGTGPSPRDVTPEATRDWCDREVPGIAEYLRARSLAETPNSVFSRGIAAMRGRQYAVNFPGSEGGARFYARLLAPLLRHGVEMARGGGH
jgi:molybdenum cofactor synthesis domain-containing protein